MGDAHSAANHASTLRGKPSDVKRGPHWIETTARAPGSFRPLARSRELSSHRGPKTARVSGERQTSRVPVRGGAAARGEGSPCDLRAFGCEKDHRYPPRCPFLVAAVAGVGGRDHNPEPRAFLLDAARAATTSSCVPISTTARGVCCRSSDPSGERPAPPFDAITRSVPSRTNVRGCRARLARPPPRRGEQKHWHSGHRAEDTALVTR